MSDIFYKVAIFLGICVIIYYMELYFFQEDLF